MGLSSHPGGPLAHSWPALHGSLSYKVGKAVLMTSFSCALGWGQWGRGRYQVFAPGWLENP